MCNGVSLKECRKINHKECKHSFKVHVHAHYTKMSKQCTATRKLLSVKDCNSDKQGSTSMSLPELEDLYRSEKIVG